MEIGIPPSDFPISDKFLGGSSNIEGLQSEEIPRKEEFPVSETMEIENPCSDSPESDQTLGGSAKIEVNGEKIDGVQSSKTLIEISLEGDKELEDGMFLEIPDVKEGGDKLEDAQISEALDESIKEGGKDIDDAEFSKIVGESQDNEVLENLDQMIDFGDNGEGEDSPDRKGLGYYPHFGSFHQNSRPNGPWTEFGSPNQCMCTRCIEDEEDAEEPYSSNHAMIGPMRRPYYGSDARHMGMMHRDHHHRRHCRRRNHRFCARDRETEMYGFRYPYCNLRRGSERLRLMEFSEPEPCHVGSGLANLGNTCFLNAIMQCFTHTVSLVQGLLSLKHAPSSHGADEFCVLCAVRDQVEFSLGYSGLVISPTYLVDNLSKISSFFQRYQQEDAHEFLQCLLDKLDSNWSKYEESAINLSAPGSSPSSSSSSSSFDDTLVRQIFGGRLVSQIRCCNCGHNSDTYEPLIDLSLEIEDVDSLESALNSFTKVESIEDTEKFTCDGCKEQVKVEKQLILDQAPSVAALHLKRFKSDGVMVEKIDKKVAFPLELDLGPYTKGSNNGNEDLKYELFAVVVHVGISSTSGHYFCFIRTDPEKWYRFDDSKVTMVSEEIVLCQDAYILFYARKGTPWFGSLIDKWKVECHQKISSTSPKSVLDDMNLPSTSYSVGSGLHGVEVGGNRDTIGDTSPTSTSEQLGQDKFETKAGAATRPHSCDSCEADGKRDVTGDTSVTPATELMQDEVNTNAIYAQDAVVPNQIFASSWSVPNNVEVKDDKFELAVLSLMEEDDATEDKTPSKKVGEIEQTNDGTCTSSHLENMSGVEPKDDIGIKPSTPARAPSPDIYSDEEPAEEAFRIPLDHLKIKDKSSSAKKFINKEKQDIKRKEAMKYVRSMPSGRRQLFLAAINGPRTDSSLFKRKKRQQSPKKRVKVSPKRVLRPVTV
ncbi:ubiquitin carboxyl-terminal hydrolase 36-like [Chenopodium quinoa]|uniref:ubiquitin carboxyl-terminal hydrolase 36-like n=1 Tax=Chenopodium quinoa TaxID=63459 RepID=UPI000B78F98E|nr:ubiquitin carboxyl-terminal hydrolase 36-like [Chenopodium quinoa]